MPSCRPGDESLAHRCFLFFFFYVFFSMNRLFFSFARHPRRRMNVSVSSTERVRRQLGSGLCLEADADLYQPCARSGLCA